MGRESHRGEGNDQNQQPDRQRAGKETVDDDRERERRSGEREIRRVEIGNSLGEQSLENQRIRIRLFRGGCLAGEGGQ